ncbi:MAG: beta-ketoacyl synthase N-terminal-like domain-containing protein [Paludibacteraceae bacterium]|nr:beta-ketoacyl synthase N-terminal-like domain-containing protein [Paludibacteraceae bacterium]
MNTITTIAHYISSPLAQGSQENFDAMMQGNTALQWHKAWSPVQPFMASRFAQEQPLWQRMVHTIQQAWAQTHLPIASNKVVLVVSSTKGSGLSEPLHALANKVAKEVGITTQPLVVSNACISGLCAIIAAKRLLQNGMYSHAIVVGADELSPFIVSGFQSFKALSTSLCKPFDAQRCGLNLGEAVAVMVLSNLPEDTQRSGAFVVESGAIRNDANHISGPSRTGEGCYRALQAVLGLPTSVTEQPTSVTELVEVPEVTQAPDITNLAFVGVHGTSTPYNDEMESIALYRAELLDVPTVGFKGYYGHTLGTAGVLETILSMLAIEHGVVPATKGFETLGVSHPVSVSAQAVPTQKTSFVKLLSGFGGCNAAVYCKQVNSQITNSPHHRITELPERSEFTSPHHRITELPERSEFNAPIHHVSITPTQVRINNQLVSTEKQGKDLLVELYKKYNMQYPKFFKMDTLCKLGFVASELLLDAEGAPRFEPTDTRAVVLANASSSLCNDTHYQATIEHAETYFPSPALFVYTLPNIVTGEIAIRNKYFGETSFYIYPQFTPQVLAQLQTLAFGDAHTQSALVGWVECSADDVFEAQLYLVTRNQSF